MREEIEYCFTHRVYIEDTDQMGIVYHANHLRFFERARTELLRENGLSLTTMAIYDTHFAIHDVHIRYIFPARLDDVLMIKTKCEQKKACGLLFRQLMYNQSEQLLSEATIQVVCVDKNLKPKRLAGAWLESMALS